MSTKQSGAANIHFEFFNQMDLIFGKNPSCKPISTANSQTGYHAPNSTSTASASAQENKSDDDETMQPPSPKKKKTFQKTVLDSVVEIQKKAEEREKLKEEREAVKHNLRLQFLKQTSAKQISELLTKIIDKI